MLCEKPYVGTAGTYPCGQCRPCRINRRRVWTHRIMLEASMYRDNAFVGLSYDDKNLVHTSTGLPTLHPPHQRDFLNRLRTSIAPHKIRFYAVGEYGDETFRPHHHAILFNFPTCLRGRTLRRPESGDRPLWRECCSQCRLVGEKWRQGDVDLGTVGVESAQYCCGYVNKKMTHKDDPRLLDRHPEFSRMSLKPGIGADFMHEVGSVLLQYGEAVLDQGDVPSSLVHGRRQLPLGRYLQGKLRETIGMDKRNPLYLDTGETTTVESWMRRMQVNQERAQETKEIRQQKIRNMLTRMDIHKGKRNL